MTHDHTKSSNIFPKYSYKMIWGGITLILLSITIGLLVARYQAQLRNTEERLDNLAAVYDENILLLMSNLESMMRAVGTQLQNQQGVAELDQYLEQVVGQLPHLDGLFILNSEGIVVADSRLGNDAVGNDNSEGILFRVHIDDQKDSVFIRDPLLTQLDNKWVIPISYGMYDATGNLETVVVASIEASYFSGALSNFTTDMENDIKGYILNGDGIIMASVPFAPDQISLVVNESPIYSLITSTADNGIVEESGIASPDIYVTAFHKVLPYEFVVMFFQPKSEFLKDYSLTATLVLIIVLILDGIIYFVLRSQSRQMQEIYRQSQLLRTLIDNIPDYIFVKDFEGRFIETNVAHAAAVNLDRDTMIGQTATDLFSADHAIKFNEDDQKVLDGGTIFNEERITRDHHSNPISVLTTKVPLKDDTGKIIGLVGISRNITDRVKAEEQKIEAERIKLEMEKERQIIELKERFIATASHDFRTPLSIIQSSASLLERYIEQYTKQQQISKIQRIYDQVNYMTKLLDDVLTISKIHARKMNLVLEDIDLREFSHALWQDIVSLDNGKHPKKLSYRTNSNQIFGDPNLLRQALSNLLTNALKYTPQGNTVEFLIDSDDQWLVFKVIDQGYGIPKDDQHQIFEPFHRALNVGNIKGTGLGLTIVKDYIELHDGSITFSSKEGEGTTFTVKIPLSSGE